MKSRKNAGVETGYSLIRLILGRVCGISFLMLFFLFLIPKVSFAKEQILSEVRLTGSPTSISAGTLPDPNVKSETAHVKARVFEYYLTALKHGYDWRWWNENKDYWDDFRVGKKSEYHYHTPIAYADGTRYGLNVWITTDAGYSIDESTKIYFNNQEYNTVGKTKIYYDGSDAYVTLDLGIATGTANLYTIEYDSKGGSAIPSQTVEEGHLSALWQSPKKDACTFLGWYLDEEGTRKFDNKEPIRENMTLYAKWRSNALLPEIRLYSDRTILPAGPVPSVKVTSGTEQVQTGVYEGYKGYWRYWNRLRSVWNYLSEEGVAKDDGTVYGLCIPLYFQDGYYANEKTKVYFNDRECLSLGHTVFYAESVIESEYAELYLDYGRVGTGVFSERNEEENDLEPENPTDENSDSSGNSESAGSSDSGISGSSNSGSSVNGSSGSSSASGSASTGGGSSSGSSGSSAGNFSGGGGAGSSSGGGGGAGSSSGGGGGASGTVTVSSGTTGQVLGVERASFDGKWMQDAKGWWIQYGDGSYPKNEWKLLPWNNTTAWYFFDEAGYMKTGWLNHNGKWYFLSTVSDGSLGAMKTGWLQDTSDGNWYYLDAVSGEMKTGWQEVSGKLYYLNTEKSRPFGAMYRNEKTPDGMQVDESGAKIG